MKQANPSIQAFYINLIGCNEKPRAGEFMRGVYAVVLGFALGASGCTTITRGTKDALQINTTPSGAQVQTSNGFSCASTPCAIRMPRRSELAVNITKAECRPVTVNVTHKTATAGAADDAGNVVFGGVIGLAVDAGTGASQDLVPNPVEVDLVCK